MENKNFGFMRVCPKAEKAMAKAEAKAIATKEAIDKAAPILIEVVDDHPLIDVLTRAIRERIPVGIGKKRLTHFVNICKIHLEFILLKVRDTELEQMVKDYVKNLFKVINELSKYNMGSGSELSQETQDWVRSFAPEAWDKLHALKDEGYKMDNSIMTLVTLALVNDCMAVGETTSVMGNPNFWYPMQDLFISPLIMTHTDVTE